MCHKTFENQIVCSELKKVENHSYKPMQFILLTVTPNPFLEAYLKITINPKKNFDF